MSGLRRTFSEGKRVARTTNFSVSRGFPSLEKNSTAAGPGESLTDTGIRPKFFPSDCWKRRMTRSFHFADAASESQVRRKVSPRSTAFGRIEHCWEEVMYEKTKSEKTEDIKNFERSSDFKFWPR